MRTVVGSIVLLAGLVMLVLPGPAVIVVPNGLAILALEFSWARSARQTARSWFNKFKCS